MPRPQDLLQKLLALPPRTLAFGGGGLAVTVFLLVGVPYVLDGTRQGQNIAQQIALATGQRVRIEGAVHVGLFPTPSISLNQIQLISRDGTATLLSAERLSLDVSFGSLLGGPVALSSVTLTHPAFTMAIDPATGQTSWLPSLTLASALGVNTIEINKGQLVVQNGTTQEMLLGVSGRMVLGKGDTFAEATLSGTWRKAPLTLEAYISQPQNDGLSYTRAKLSAEAAGAALSLEGKWPVAMPLAPKALEAGALDVALEAKNAANLWATLATLLPDQVPLAPQDPALQEPLALKAELKQDKNPAVLDLPTVSLKLGAMDVMGLMRYQRGQPQGLSVALRTSLLDLSAWPSLMALTSQKTLPLPQNWVMAYDVSCASVLTPAGLLLEAVEAKGALKDGVLSVDEASATVSGSNRATLKGTLQAQANGTALIDGHLTFNSTQLRSFLDALHQPIPEGIDDTALRQLNLSADFRGTWPKPDLSGLEATFDGATVKGTLTPRVDATGAQLVDATLSIARLDPARYGLGFSLPAWLWDLPQGAWSLALTDFRLGGQYVDKASITARLMPEALAIQSADLSGWLGAHLTMAGTLAKPDGPVTTTLTTTVQTEDFSVLRPALAALPPVLPAAVSDLLSGPMVISSRLTKEAGGAAQNLVNMTLGDQAKVDLVLTEQNSALTAFKARVQHPNASAVLGQLGGLALSPEASALGALDLYAEGALGQGGLWSVRNMQGHIGNALGLLSGELTLLPALPATVRGTFSFSDLDLDTLRRALPAAWLGGLMAGDVSVSAQKVTLFDQTFTKASTKISLQGNDATVQNATAKWHGGEVVADGKLTLAPLLSLDGTLEIKGASTDLATGQRYGLTGVMDLSVKAHTAGAGADSLWAALDGDGDITLSDGTLSGLDLAALGKAVKSAPSADKVDLTGLLARGGTSALQALGGDFTIEEGRVSLPKLLLLTRDSKAEGAVTLDLKSNQIDGRTTLRFGDRADAPSLLLQLGGALNAVTLGPDASAAAPLVIPETPEASIQSSGKMKVVKGVALEADTTGTSEAAPLSPKDKKIKQAAPTVNGGMAPTTTTASDSVPLPPDDSSRALPATIGDADSMTQDVMPKNKQSVPAASAAELEMPTPPRVHSYDTGADTTAAPSNLPLTRAARSGPSITRPPEGADSGQDLPPPPSIDAMLKSLPQLAATARGDVAPDPAPLGGAPTAPQKVIKKTTSDAPALKGVEMKPADGSNRPATKSAPKTVIQNGVAETRYGNLIIRTPAEQAAEAAAAATAGAARKVAPSDAAAPMPTFEPVP